MRHLLHADASVGPYSGSRNNPGDDTAASSDRPASKLAVWWGDMIAVGPGRIRTANPDGTPGHPARCRWATHANFTPPYTFGGRILIRSHDGPLHPTYGMVFHPVHVSNLNNLWIRFGTSDDQCVLGVEVNDVEVRIRYHPFPVPEFGRWHDWAIHVDAGHAVTFTWNGRQVARWSDERIDVFAHGPVGMRLDGFDAELDGTYVDDGRPEPEGDDDTMHARSTWERYTPHKVTGPAIDWAQIDTAVIHYTAAPNVPDGDNPDAVARYLAAIQTSYAVNRGYSIGYLVAVDKHGGAWQLRAWDIKSAANAGHNDHTFPVLCLVDGAEAATPAMAATVRAVIAEAERRARRKLSIVGHSDLSGAATACPGVGLRAQVKAGVFTPKIPDPVKPPPLPPFEEDDMQRIARGPDGQTIWRGNGVVRKHVKTQREYDIIRLDSATGNGPKVTTIHGAELPASLGEVPQVEAAAIESLGAVVA